MELIIFIGVQGAGKSTFYSNYFFHTHLRINLDMLKTKHREKLLIQACLEAKQPFVIDKTNPACEDRQAYIDLAKQYQFQVKAYYFDSSFDKALQRNNQRNGKQKFPEVGLKAVLKKMQKPLYSEGFDKIYTVENLDENGFEVKEIER